MIKKIAKMVALLGPLALACEEILAAVLYSGFWQTASNVIGAVAAIAIFAAVAVVTQFDEELVSEG